MKHLTFIATAIVVLTSYIEHATVLGSRGFKLPISDSVLFSLRPSPDKDTRISGTVRVRGSAIGQSQEVGLQDLLDNRELRHER